MEWKTQNEDQQARALTAAIVGEQARDIMREVLDDETLDDATRDALAGKMAEHPTDPARALLEHFLSARLPQFAQQESTQPVA
ncbi:hypothetical protein [Sinomonas mesophila]|uniref:hypothetical protein n=1 Tax=Sinomonas mesophila TaxID=1531955 RepID=UPI0009877AFF|nr:hypothetical protein [Sinomonas mesophila]